MGKIAEFFGLRKKKTNNQTFAESNPFLFGLEDYPWERSTNNELKVSAVYAAITTISATMAKIPFYVMNENTKEHLDDANLYKALNVQPNELMNATVMNGMLAVWLLIYGEAYVLPKRRYRGLEVEQRIPFSPKNVTKYIDKTNYKLYYDLTFMDGHVERHAASDVEHYMWFTTDGINGISPLDHAKSAIQTGLNQDEYSQRVLENYNRPLDYLKTVTDLSSKPKIKRVKGKDSDGKDVYAEVSAKDLMREEWVKARKSAGGGTAILDNGLEYGSVPQITPDQMQFVTSKDVTVQDIARFFRMGSCMYKLGVGKQSYSTNEQAQICYINETILPIVRQWEHELTIKLLPQKLRDEGWQIRGNEKVELRGDAASQLAWLKGNKEMGVYSINEIRNILELPKIGELGDVRTIGPNAVPLEKAVSGETPAQVTPNPISEENDNDNAGESGSNGNNTQNNKTA